MPSNRFPNHEISSMFRDLNALLPRSAFARFARDPVIGHGDASVTNEKRQALGRRKWLIGLVAGGEARTPDLGL